MPDLPRAVTVAVRRALEREPSRRFTSCTAFAEAFAEAAGITVPGLGRPTGGSRVSKAALRPSGAVTTMATDIAAPAAWGKAAWITVLAILIVAVGVGALIAFRRPTDPDPVRRASNGPAATPDPSARVGAGAPRPDTPASPNPTPSPPPIPNPDPPAVVPPPSPNPTLDPASPPSVPAMDPPSTASPPAVAPTPTPPVGPSSARLPPPTLVLEARTTPIVTAATKYGVRGRVTPSASRVTIAGRVAVVREDGSFSEEVALEVEGGNVIAVTAENADGDVRRDQVTVVRDRTAPKVVVTEPAAGAEIEGDTLVVRGRVEDRSGFSVTVGTVAASVRGAEFEASVPVAADGPAIVVTARDEVGNVAEPVVVTWRRKTKSALEGLTPKGTNSAGLAEYSLVRDPTVVLVLVPAGSFAMGAVAGDGAVKEGESPARRVTLGAYLIAKWETSWAQWGRFCVATSRPVPPAPSWSTPDHPATGISFADAKAYCVWAGVRLPSEAEWEKAARARTVGALYDWGTDDTPPAKSANLFDSSRRKKLKLTRTHFTDYDDGFVYTSPVGSFAANGFGLFDATGNVWEWCADGYEADAASLPAIDPFVPAEKRPLRVARGGGFDSKPDDCRLSRRNAQPPDFRNDSIGMRVARNGPK